MPFPYPPWREGALLVPILESWPVPSSYPSWRQGMCLPRTHLGDRGRIHSSYSSWEHGLYLLGTHLLDRGHTFLVPFIGTGGCAFLKPILETWPGIPSSYPSFEQRPYLLRTRLGTLHVLSSWRKGQCLPVPGTHLVDMACTFLVGCWKLVPDYTDPKVLIKTTGWKHHNGYSEHIKIASDFSWFCPS